MTITNITLNGRPCRSDARTLYALWRQETGAGDGDGAGSGDGDARRGYAIARNGALVPRDQWERTPLAENDQVEIVRAMPGG